MAQESFHNVVVALYGMDFTDKGYAMYLDDVARFCNAVKPHSLTLTGGPTAPNKRPDDTEAGEAWKYLEPKLEEPKPVVLLENEALTTYDNFANSRKMLTQCMFLTPGDRTTVFGNSAKKFIIKLLARHFLKPSRVTVVPVTWPLGDNPWWAQILVNVILIGAIFYPPIGRWWHNLRAKHFAKS